MTPPMAACTENHQTGGSRRKSSMSGTYTPARPLASNSEGDS